MKLRVSSLEPENGKKREKEKKKESKIDNAQKGSHVLATEYTSFSFLNFLCFFNKEKMCSLLLVPCSLWSFFFLKYWLQQVCVNSKLIDVPSFVNHPAPTDVLLFSIHWISLL